MTKRFGEQFLHQQTPELHTTQPVEHEQSRKKIKGEEISPKPAEKLADWLELLERTHTGHRDKPEVLERIKRSYHKQYIIKPEDIPENYWDLQRRIIVSEGRGGDFEKDEQGKIIIPEEAKEQAEQVLISDQEKSLDKWLDYLTSPDADVYPMWAKYWAFTSMAKMGKLEKLEGEDGQETARFQKRTKDTVSPFPPLNPRALAMTIGVIQEMAERKQRIKDEKQKPKAERQSVPEMENKSVKLDDKEFQALLSTENFSKIYSQFLIEMPEYSTEGLKNIEGKWVKYNQGSKPDKLVASLEGHPLEWCTANPDTARTQLGGGDFYVYYSYGQDDEPDNPSIPRIAIRMEGENKIAEVRGIAKDQNFDPYIAPVLEKKLSDFGQEGERYQKASADMKMLTAIGEKMERSKELNRDELIFLYEVDSNIEGFGYQKDPRIKDILNERNILADIEAIYECDFSNPRQRELGFIYGVGSKPTPRAFIEVMKRLRQGRNIESDTLIIFDCEPNQIIHNEQEIQTAIKNKIEVKAYIGQLFPNIFKLLPNTLEHIYTEFPEGKIKQKTIELGTGLKTKDEFINAIEQQGGGVSDWTKDIMSKAEFVVSNKESKEDLIILTVKALGFPNGSTVKEIFERAKKFGLELCPPETGPQLRLQYPEQPVNEYCLIGMEPIAGSDGGPGLFYVSRDDDKPWLRSHDGRPGHGYVSGNRFAFVRASKT